MSGDLADTHTPGATGRVAGGALVWRLRLLAAVVAFAALAFRQSTGLVVPDTKVDLTADPAGFLARALHLWDPQGAFGQLQNQAYGYLFPVGPFHLALSSLGMPAWVVQRLWWTAVFAVALVGMWLLTKAFGVTSPWARLISAIAFAASPRLVAEVAVTSVEVWPLAVAPWVLLPLLITDRSMGWRASRSALAFFVVGAVNAAATLATLVLPALWLLTRRWNWPHVRLSLAWAIGIVAVSIWWIIPLVVLGRFSPPFLSWIENASVTTSTASAFEAIRGTSAWLGFLRTDTGPSWPAAWLQITVPAIAISTVLVVAIGLLGMTGARGARGYLVLGTLVGLALVTFGHTGGWTWPWASSSQALLDGTLAPFRNTHKFELVVRIPIIVGVGFALERAFIALRRRFRPARARSRARALAAFAVAGVLVAYAAPAIAANMARPEGYRAIPNHWVQAAAWLDAQTTPGSVLVTPSANFADFTWGSTKDDPLQALARRPFVVRDAVPLGSAGATRFLDSVMDRLASGQSVKRLESTLSMAGVAFVLVRHDIRLDAQGDQPGVIARSLQESGLDLVASFGPMSGAYGESASVTVDYRTLLQRPSIEIYGVDRSERPGAPRVVPLDAMPVVTGGPENLPAVVGAIGAVDVLRDVDVPGAITDQPRVLTDGLRRREVNFGEPAHNTSGLLEASDPGRSGRAVIDYAVPGSTSVLEWRGVRSVTASSSASDAYATLRIGPGHGPAQALDGDSRTRWVSGRFGEAVGEWLRVDFTGPTSVAGTRIVLSASSPVGARPQTVLVETDQGAVVTAVIAGPGVRLRTPPGEASWLRITLTDVESGRQNGFSIAEVSVPGITATPTLAIPGRHHPDVVLLEEGKRGRSECLTLEGTVACSPTLGLAAEETGWRRSWTALSAAEYSVRGEVRPLDGDAVEKLLELPNGWTATASSRLVTAPAGRPDAGIDGDPATGWVASPADPKPWYEVSFPKQIRVAGLRITKSFELPASTPVTVSVTYDDGRTHTASADTSGFVTLPPRRTSSLRLSFGDVRLMENIDSTTGAHSFAPVGFSSLEIVGQQSATLSPSASTGVPCGFGPDLVIAGRRYETLVRGTVGDILSGSPLSWQVCRGGGLASTPADLVEVEASASAEFAPSSLSMRSPGLALPARTAVAATVERTSPSVLTAFVGERSADSALVLPQNFNAGWTATTSEGSLTPVRVNGWQQGFLMPAGPEMPLVVEFGPNRIYQFGLYLGGLLVLAVLAVVVVTSRRATAPSAAQPEALWAASPVVGTVIAVLAGGPPALAAGVVAIVVARRWGQAAWLGAIALLMAGLVTVLWPFPEHRTSLDSPVVQALVWTSILAVLWSRPLRRLTRTERMMGRSTKR
ncbi:alpha-(1-_3)-arabinofuranosyltransferase family protein [Intrasporangium sp.]|uniref:alpha-(1->3)-arabinofuranosyltransferase domain-containing protein n=1 Tax=Intrasporangium sp. TaxID=1925024 RepID=UPI00293A628B|nr:alpha-(1->3)-arabinofuranosyltransferase family protein [Intrasporangium sp.]MDV3221951.1 alpha-(1->3)-arabinofuranosyltransferase [Intrasporangium sp.]